jgi:hypothetical protein
MTPWRRRFCGLDFVAQRGRLRLKEDGHRARSRGLRARVRDITEVLAEPTSRSVR